MHDRRFSTASLFACLGVSMLCHVFMSQLLHFSSCFLSFARLWSPEVGFFGLIID